MTLNFFIPFWSKYIFTDPVFYLPYLAIGAPAGEPDHNTYIAD